LNVHPSRTADLETPDRLTATPAVPVEHYRDTFGNICARLVAPGGRFALATDTVISDGGRADPANADAAQQPVEMLPHETLLYLLGSRYCETDRLMEEAWRLFGHVSPGWSLVQAMCDFVHGHLVFGYEHSHPTRTAADAYEERHGVCRDFTHLAITLCRCMKVPARYCTGYLSDIGQPVAAEPMDFAAWMEVWLGDGWWVFDPRNNARRIGRILVARGRDAADVPLAHTFGPNELVGFRVWTDEVAG
jgi:transglutaminase-like putative cysteine protease